MRSEFHPDDIEYARASTGKRFANYIIDLLIFYVAAITIGVILYVGGVLNPDPASLEDSGADLVGQIISILLYAIFMSAQETIFKGKTIGKFITNTRAVYYDGSYISANTAFARGLSRAVPFNALSALGNPANPWHDRWTNTMVIDERLLLSESDDEETAIEEP